MLAFVELHLDEGWDADPNAPEPRVSISGSTVEVRFRLLRLFQGRPSGWGFLDRLTSFIKGNPDLEDGCGTLRFFGCSRWRWDDTNDHAWYEHNGRYSHAAPNWGKFYELVGEDPIRDAVPWEGIQPDAATSRHFLFYFRDEALEFMADGWSFTPDPVV